MWLYLFRHGIAWDREDPLCPPDSERPLTPKGVHKTRSAATGIRRLEPVFDRLWVSPYLRARETLEEASDALGFREFTPEGPPLQRPVGDERYGRKLAHARRLAQSSMLRAHLAGELDHR